MAFYFIIGWREKSFSRQCGRRNKIRSAEARTQIIRTWRQWWMNFLVLNYAWIWWRWSCNVQLVFTRKFIALPRQFVVRKSRIYSRWSHEFPATCSHLINASPHASAERKLKRWKGSRLHWTQLVVFKTKSRISQALLVPTAKILQIPLHFPSIEFN